MNEFSLAAYSTSTDMPLERLDEIFGKKKKEKQT